MVRYPPTVEIESRMQEHGRIRLGVKGDGPFPKSINTFRFTSADGGVLSEIAMAYGGQVNQWQNGDKKEFEVITDYTEIPVVLPPDPLSGPVYELWGGGGLIRRCNGTTFHEAIDDPTEAPPEFHCYCNQYNIEECKVTLRLRVMLPNFSFGGQWLLVTHSWNAAAEMPGMVALVNETQSRGYTSATLSIDKRVRKAKGKPKKIFNVPVLKPNIALTTLTDTPELEAGTIPVAGELVEGDVIDEQEDW